MPEDWKKQNVTSVFRKGKKDPGNYRLISLTLILEKVMEQLIPETISILLLDMKMIRSRIHKEGIILYQHDNLL